MITTSATVICVVLSWGFLVFHLLLLSGAPLGEYILGGEHRILPKKMRATSAFFAGYFAVIGLCYLSYLLSDITFLHPVVRLVLVILNTAFMGYAIYGNGYVTKSKKEKYVMTPLSAIGFVCSVITLIDRS